MVGRKDQIHSRLLKIVIDNKKAHFFHILVHTYFHFLFKPGYHIYFQAFVNIYANFEISDAEVGFPLFVPMSS